MPDDLIEEPTPDPAEMDRARVLAESAQAQGSLSADGHDDQQIADWAQSFIADQGQPADVAGFLDWCAMSATTLEPHPDLRPTSSEAPTPVLGLEI